MIISDKFSLSRDNYGKNEISLVKQALTIWSSLDAWEPVHQYLKPHVEKDKVLFLISGDYASCTVPLKAIQSETKRETVKILLYRHKDEYPATVAHATEERKVRGKGTVRIPYRSFSQTHKFNQRNLDAALSEFFSRTGKRI